jgi:NADPH2:quinone reductase
MKAVSFAETGDASVLSYKTDVPSPILQEPHHLLIRNKCVGVNFIDTYHRSGLYKVPLPCIPGREGAGIIEEVGSGVNKAFKKGDRVAYLGMGTYAELTRLETGALFSPSFDFDASSMLNDQQFYRILGSPPR